MVRQIAVSRSLILLGKIIWKGSLTPRGEIHRAWPKNGGTTRVPPISKIFLLHVGHKAPASQRETFQRYKVVQVDLYPLYPWQKIASAVPMRKFTTAREAFVFAPCFYLAWTDALEISTHVAPQNMHFCKVRYAQNRIMNPPTWLLFLGANISASRMRTCIVLDWPNLQRVMALLICRPLSLAWPGDRLPKTTTRKRQIWEGRWKKIKYMVAQWRRPFGRNKHSYLFLWMMAQRQWVRVYGAACPTRCSSSPTDIVSAATDLQTLREAWTGRLSMLPTHVSVGFFARVALRTPDHAQLTVRADGYMYGRLPESRDCSPASSFFPRHIIIIIIIIVSIVLFAPEMLMRRPCPLSWLGSPIFFESPAPRLAYDVTRMFPR